MFAASSHFENSAKARYTAALRNAFILAVTFHVLLLLFSPPFESRPYALPPPEEPMVAAQIAEIIIPSPPAEVKPPHIVIPVPHEDGIDEKLAPSLVDSFPPMPFVDREPPPTRPFVAFDVAPEPILLVKPDYPRLAREAGIEGMVHIKVVIDETGKVIEASVLTSDVTPDMERCALKAARRCLFEPARQGTEAVKAAVSIPFEFRLE